MRTINLRMPEIRDPIYGFIHPSPTELKIINTEILQRLRRIKQLGMAYLAYPGANHTRFDHSLGVLHVASKMAAHLLPEEQRRLVGMAALLHDVGHGPFSHISEDLLEKYSEIPGSKDKIHEVITADIIRSDPQLSTILSEDDRKAILSLLKGDHAPLSIMSEIISGPIDADKMDYLLRDSYFCGVKYGVFDIERLLSTLTSFEDQHDLHLAVLYGGVNSLEQFILAKYYMITQVIRHKIRSISDAMIVRGLELGIEADGLKMLHDLYTYEGSSSYLRHYLEYWDEKVVTELLTIHKGSHANILFERLHKRYLFKQVFSEKVKELVFKDENIREILIDITMKSNQGFRKRLEDTISKIPEINCKKEHVIANIIKIKSVKELFRNNEGQVMILKKNNEMKPFDSESSVLASINESLTDVYFEVYAPLEYASDKDKHEKVAKIARAIRSILGTLEV